MSTTPTIVSLPNTWNWNALSEVKEGLSKPSGERTLPTILLYDERGLRLYDDITTKAQEYYYLFNAEEQILRDNGPSIIRLMHGGSPIRNGEVLLELGAGALRKTSLLLKALANAAPFSSTPAVTYLALDLEKAELERTLSLISSSSLGPELSNRVRIGGLCGTYDDGISYVRGGGLNGIQTSPHVGASNLQPITEVKFSEATEPIVEAHLDSYVRKDDQKDTMDRLSPTQDSNGTPPFDNSVNYAPSSFTATETQSLYSTDYEEMPPIHFMFLGSSIGNFTRDEAADFLRGLPLRPWSTSSDPALGSFGDTLLLGLDHDNEPSLIETAYNDPAGYTRKFIMNGLAGVRRALEQGGMDEQTVSSFKDESWDYLEKYNLSEKRHEGHYVSLTRKSLTLGGDKIEIEEGETIHIEHSYKYSESDAQQLFSDAHLKPIHRWISANGLYSLWLLHRPAFDFDISPQRSLEMKGDDVTGPLPVFPISKTASFPTIPTLEEWADMWKLWDAVTLGMIPTQMMMEKPIDLRHKCLFYLGHIPTFLDIHLSRLLGQPHTEPDNFKYIFERGIDPHVDDPTQCHPHSEVPEEDDEWPSLDTILAFRDRVRTRLQSVYARLSSGDLASAGIPTRKAQRVLWMTFEHEAWHVETLLYMLIQKAGEDNGTLPPPGIPPPDWEALSLAWEQRRAFEKPQETRITLGPAELPLGHNDYEEDDLVAIPSQEGDHEFGWDNEHPKRMVQVGKFSVDRSPITNGEYHNFWTATGEATPPASWVVKGDEVLVRTLYGPVSISVAKDWPLIASYDELNAYAHSKGGRIPTEAELRLFMDDQASKGDVHVYNNAGWGFQRWWFEPPSLGNKERNEAPHNGGVWEWTSTIMDHHPGYQSSILYPGFSSDFFDGKHHVVLGGSFATIPRLAQRRSLRNFYQHNYPYAWVGARVAYDA